MLVTPLLLLSALATQSQAAAPRPADRRDYSPTDYTAYTLRSLEVKVGLTDQSLGLVPRMEISTNGALGALGVTNGGLKWNLLRAGPLDLSAEGAMAGVGMGEFEASWSQATLRTSVRPAPSWGVHAGVGYRDLQASGLPDFREANGLVRSLLPGDLASLDLGELSDQVDLDVHSRTVRGEVATDIEAEGSFVILRASATMWRQQDMGEAWDQAGSVRALSHLTDTETQGAVSLDHDLTLSAAWQLAIGRRVSLRLGIGSSTTPGAWLSQTTDLSVRLGGLKSKEVREAKGV